MLESWLPVVGFEKLYRVSDAGRVKRVADQKLLKQTKNRYLTVQLRDIEANKQFHRNVHRLVAEAFLGVSEVLVVNHIDHDRYNNHVSNLEWVTQQENVLHSVRAGRTAQHRKNGKFCKAWEKDATPFHAA